MLQRYSQSYTKAYAKEPKHILLFPIHLALSPTLLRTYLRTFLVLTTATFLFGVAVIAYMSFYVKYIPVRGISVPVHLQFDTGVSIPRENMFGGFTSGEPRSPYGISPIPGLVARQKYSIAVEIVLPRSEKNLEAGNWMVEVDMRAPGPSNGGLRKLLEWEEDESLSYKPGKAQEMNEKDRLTVLARARRPALLTYRSSITEYAYRFIRLPLYMLGWKHESETLSIPVFEALEFEKGWRNVASSLRLSINSKKPLEIYRVAVHFTAKLEGLRWAMYRYRLTSFVVFTTLFWGVEMGVVLCTWGVFAFLLGSTNTGEQLIQKQNTAEGHGTEPRVPKSEYDSPPLTPLSATSTTFPTLSGQQPLHYSSGESSRVKKERGTTPNLDSLPLKAEADADDEDEDEDFIQPIPVSAIGAMTDSGIGTSMESQGEGRGLVRRKSSRER